MAARNLTCCCSRQGRQHICLVASDGDDGGARTHHQGVAAENGGGAGGGGARAPDDGVKGLCGGARGPCDGARAPGDEARARHDGARGRHVGRRRRIRARWAGVRRPGVSWHPRRTLPGGSLAEPPGYDRAIGRTAPSAGPYPCGRHGREAAALASPPLQDNVAVAAAVDDAAAVVDDDAAAAVDDAAVAAAVDDEAVAVGGGEPGFPLHVPSPGQTMKRTSCLTSLSKNREVISDTTTTISVLLQGGINTSFFYTKIRLTVHELNGQISRTKKLTE